MVTITLQSRKGGQWQMRTTSNKIETVKKNAKKWGYIIVEIKDSQEA